MSRILLVDDDNDIVMLTARWFTKAGYEVATATSGKEALLMLKSETYDVILLDYTMPEMDGSATLEAIRKRKRHSKRRSKRGDTRWKKALRAVR